MKEIDSVDELAGDELSNCDLKTRIRLLQSKLHPSFAAADQQRVASVAGAQEEPPAETSARPQSASVNSLSSSSTARSSPENDDDEEEFSADELAARSELELDSISVASSGSSRSSAAPTPPPRLSSLRRPAAGDGADPIPSAQQVAPVPALPPRRQPQVASGTRPPLQLHKHPALRPNSHPAADLEPRVEAATHHQRNPQTSATCSQPITSQRLHQVACAAQAIPVIAGPTTASAASSHEFFGLGGAAPITKALKDQQQQQQRLQQQHATFVINRPASRHPIRGFALPPIPSGSHLMMPLPAKLHHPPTAATPSGSQQQQQHLGSISSASMTSISSSNSSSTSSSNLNAKLSQSSQQLQHQIALTQRPMNNPMQPAPVKPPQPKISPDAVQLLVGRRQQPAACATANPRPRPEVAQVSPSGRLAASAQQVQPQSQLQSAALPTLQELQAQLQRQRTLQWTAMVQQQQRDSAAAAATAQSREGTTTTTASGQQQQQQQQQVVVGGVAAGNRLERAERPSDAAHSRTPGQPAAEVEQRQLAHTQLGRHTGNTAQQSERSQCESNGQQKIAADQDTESKQLIPKAHDHRQQQTQSPGPRIEPPNGQLNTRPPANRINNSSSSSSSANNNEQHQQQRPGERTDFATNNLLTTAAELRPPDDPRGGESPAQHQQPKFQMSERTSATHRLSSGNFNYHQPHQHQALNPHRHEPIPAPRVVAAHQRPAADRLCRYNDELSITIQQQHQVSGARQSLASPSARMGTPLSDNSTCSPSLAAAAMDPDELIPKLIERLDRKLVVLKEEQLNLVREYEINEASGRRLFESMKSHLTVNEFEKITTHASEIEKVTKLILSLKLRLKRIEAELREREQTGSRAPRHQLHNHISTSSRHQQQVAAADVTNTTSQRELSATETNRGECLGAKSENPPKQQSQQLSSQPLTVRGLSDPTSTIGLPKRSHQHHSSLQASGDILQASSSSCQSTTSAAAPATSAAGAGSLQPTSTDLDRSGQAGASADGGESTNAAPSSSATSSSTSSDSIFNSTDSAIGSTINGLGGSVSNIESQQNLQQTATSQSSLSSQNSTDSASRSPLQSHLSSNISVSSHSSIGSSMPSSPPLMSPTSTSASAASRLSAAARQQAGKQVAAIQPLRSARVNPDDGDGPQNTSTISVDSTNDSIMLALTEYDILIAKRSKLVAQLEEAHQLEDCIVKRNDIIVDRILKKYYDDNDREGAIAEFKRFTKLKSLLLKDTHDIADKIDSAEHQMIKLRQTNQYHA